VLRLSKKQVAPGGNTSNRLVADCKRRCIPDVDIVETWLSLIASRFQPISGRSAVE